MHLNVFCPTNKAVGHVERKEKVKPTPTSVPTSTPVPTATPSATPEPTAGPTATPESSPRPTFGSNMDGFSDGLGDIGKDYLAKNGVIDRTVCSDIKYVAHITFDNGVVICVQEDLTRFEMMTFEIWYRNLLNLGIDYSFEFVNIGLDNIKYSYDFLRKFRYLKLMTRELHYGYYDKELMDRINNVKSNVKKLQKLD